MSVNSFDPTQQQQALDADLVRQLLDLLVEQGDQPPELSTEQASQFAGLAIHPGWAEYAPGLADEDIVRLIRLFTVGEDRYSGWQAGDKSPVVPLVRELKKRGVFDTEFTRWIKANTSNRFLPHGSLMDRL